MNNQQETTSVAIIDPKEFGIDLAKAKPISESFLPKIAERDGYVEVYKAILSKELTKETCAEASALRKKLVKVRTGIAEIHKTEKAFYLASGRYVDALKNKITLPIEQMEEELSKIEKHFENLEKERIEKLNQERIAIVAPYLDDVSNLNLAQMDSDVFAAYVSAKKTAYEARIAEQQRIEAERVAAIEAEKAERERIRKENEALRIEAERKEKELAEERRIAEERQKKVEAEAAAERKRLEAIAEQERKEHEKQLAKEKAERERIERELAAEKERIAAEERARKEAEIAAQKEREAAELQAKKDAEKLAKAPIKKQLSVWVSSFSISETDIDNDTASAIKEKFADFKKWAQSEIEKM